MYIVKKSRFLVQAVPVSSISEANVFFSYNENNLANHNCWAYRINDSYRYFDDNEPHGTAGRPILQAIDELNLNMVAVLVTRWFGGIKLGKGGLMRAYKASVTGCLSHSNFIEIKDTLLIKCTIAVKDMHIIYNLDNSVSIVSNHFNNSNCEFIIEVQKDKIDSLKNTINKISKGSALLCCL
ncbi:YigZ family protein [Candidatus Kinetoplastidibacterium galati]|nr:YigZ family protein [Candidatus Kinetoplastibacterium galatii]